jgi:hypothetical protein
LTIELIGANFKLVVPIAEPPPNARIITFAECVQIAEVELPDAPRTLKQALARPDRLQWKTACDTEYASLMKHSTWSLVPLPKGKIPIDSRWVFKQKFNADGSLERYKARLVAKGFTQRAGIDFDEIFSPVARGESIRTLIAIAVQRQMYIHQMDVKTAFLNGHLEEEIYMNQPSGYVQNPGLVCKLHRSIYGLKQAPRCWNKEISSALKQAGFAQLQADWCLFRKTLANDDHIFLAIYVDDIIIAADKEHSLNSTKQQLSKLFEMSGMGELHYKS